jgi:hypothetical protein
MKKRRVEVMIETHQTWIIRQAVPPPPAWCAGCARMVRMITAEEAARLVHQSTRTIYTWVEADRLHYRETPEGFLHVCLDSLFAGAADAPAPRGGGVTEILHALERAGTGGSRDYGHET